MIEIIMFACVVVIAVRVALMENMSGLLWGVIAVAACVGCIMLPWPYLRCLVALGVMVVAFMVRKFMRGGLG